MTKKPLNDYVLLVEPDEVLAKAYIKALEISGYRVHHAGVAQAAVMLVDTQKPKLIIMELQLRSHNGIEFLYELRSHTDLKGIPIILLTFVPQPSNEAEGMHLQRLNVKAYLYKPHTSLEKLTNIVEGVLSG